MAYLEIKNVRIAGISAGAPKQTICNLNLQNLSKDYDAAAFVETTGVYERHVDDLTVSDLCIPAAEKLIADLGWSKDEIDAVVFVSQHADYILPATSCIIQNKLGLSKECFAEDIALGCSGWVYGLSNVCSLVSTGNIKKALLMNGDAKKRIKCEDALFGFAGTVTALEYKEGAESFKFHLGTDGSGYDAIIIPDGGARNQVSAKSFDLEEIDGRKYTRLESRMKGMDVFSFGISTAPKSVKKLAEHFQFDYQECDYLLLHQANMKMNNMIAKKLKFAPEKVPSSMYNFGNTSSASIPLTIVTQLKERAAVETKYVCCGFGVGLSWGTVTFKTECIVLSDLVLVEKDEEAQWV
nr:ketoacyl-ACP synthase III [uncultured Macellibacteroides sp.]